MKQPIYIKSVRSFNKSQSQTLIQDSPVPAKESISKVIAPKEEALKPLFCESFHGESWYRCPSCKVGFEFYDAFFNSSRCPHCQQLLDQS